MSVVESLPVALFVMVIVFAVLASLCAFIMLFSIGVQAVEKRRERVSVRLSLSEPETASEAPAFSAGNLKLHNVDEQTAAMIMAIVSDESGIPLSELQFKSIKAKEPQGSI
jgi:hypothetical protein